MNQKPYSRILDDVARDQTPADVNLTPQIMTRIQKGKGTLMQSTLKFWTATLLMLFLLIGSFFVVPAVAAAIQRWLGYVPGVGLVREGDVRTLPAPVVVTRDGITLTVEQVLLDTERTTLTYNVEDIPLSAVARQDEQRCDYRVSLRLPDNTLLSATDNGSGEYNLGHYQHRVVFQALSSDVRQAVLLISCLYQTSSGAAPENWEIPLSFAPAPPDMTVYPVIEIPTAQASSTVETPTQAAVASSATEPASEISISLERAVEMDDGYLIYATLQWSGAPVDFVQPEKTMHLLTNSGQELAFELVDDENTGYFHDQRKIVFALKTAPIQEPGPLNIRVDSLAMNLPTDAIFSFDPGPVTENESTLELNQDVQVGAYTLHITRVRISKNGYSFDMSSKNGILSANLSDADHPLMGGGGYGLDLSGFFSSSFFYEGERVQGPIKVLVSSVDVLLSGPWQVQWTPPAISSSVSPTRPADSAACLNAETWKSALAQNPPLPAGLTGKLLIYGPDGPSGDWAYFLVHPDGTGLQKMEPLMGLFFSPDGSQRVDFKASNSEAGIFVTNLATNQVIKIPDTTASDVPLAWTPDSKQIIFAHGRPVSDIFIVNADGAGQRLLARDIPGPLAVDWVSEGLIYRQQDDLATYLLNIQTGQSRLFSEHSIVAVSPDKQHIVTEEATETELLYRTYLSALDGSNRILLADSDLRAYSSLWTPDGNWLLFYIYEKNSDKGIPALVNISTCQVIHLRHINGNIEAWLP